MSCATETRYARLLELPFSHLDNCKKFGLVFDNVVGIVEVINSKDIQIQVSGLYSHTLHCQSWLSMGHSSSCRGQKKGLIPPRKHPIPVLSKHSSIVGSLGKPCLYPQSPLVCLFFLLPPILYESTCLTISILGMANELGT